MDPTSSIAETSAAPPENARDPGTSAPVVDAAAQPHPETFSPPVELWKLREKNPAEAGAPVMLDQAAAPPASPAPQPAPRVAVPQIDLSPVEADPELPESLRERHAGIKSAIERVEKKRQAATFERNRTRETLAEQFDMKKMERIRVLRSDILKLSQEKLKIRANLSAWLSDCIPAMEAISKKNKEALAATKQAVLEKLHSIGFTEAAGERNRGKFLVDELIAMHPDVRTLIFRLREVNYFIDGLINPGREGSPSHHNDLRIKAIAAELQEAIKHNEQLISMV